MTKLTVKMFADGADKASMLKLYEDPTIAGFTTNPTLMRKAGISDYESFAKDILKTITDRPISFEVFSDDIDEMKKQALTIATWGDNVYVKIPVSNTKQEPTYELIKELSDAGVKLNITAIMTLDQVEHVAKALANCPSAYVSVFAGRIADTGRDPIPDMKKALEMLKPHPKLELLWASPREVLNIYQANAMGCHIITATPDLLAKLKLMDKDLAEYSLDTVKMFRNDAVAAGYDIECVELAE